MDYRNKKVLAPMVRVGTLPFRLLAKEYGADILYSEELIDHKLVRCQRIENELLGTVDFRDPVTGTVEFRTCDEEKGNVVFQMGTSDPIRALKTAELVCRDVAAVDINMGCPKSFSMSGGMGAALLSNPELIKDILTTLRRNLNISVSCKIRLLKTTQATVELAKIIENTGVSALAVHGRKVADRPRDNAQWGEIRAVVDALSIPVIANGDVFQYDDFAPCREATGASSIMVARAAMWNASVFRPEGLLDWELVKREYVKRCVLWDNGVKYSKHTVKEMIMQHGNYEMEEGRGVNKCRNLQDLSDHYGLRDYYDSVLLERTQKQTDRLADSIVASFSSVSLDSRQFHCSTDLPCLKDCDGDKGVMRENKSRKI